MNPSPLRYPGGKYKLYPYVSRLVQENNCATYIEPFCGGAAIALGLLFDGIVKKVIINDYDYTIYCFWDSILQEILLLKVRLEHQLSLPLLLHKYCLQSLAIFQKDSVTHATVFQKGTLLFLFL